MLATGAGGSGLFVCFTGLSLGLLADKSKGTPVGCPLLYEKNFSVIDFLILVARLARQLEAELI